MRPFYCLFFLLPVLLTACSSEPRETDDAPPAVESRNALHEAPKTTEAPTIDGRPDEACWQAGEWYPLNQTWLGNPPAPDDFRGRFKVAWSPAAVYVLAEIVDDTLIDIHPDGLAFYWDDDCLEIFIDEDHSGGIHQYNHNAFAYHLALDGRVADIGPDSLEHYYDSHLRSARVSRGDTTTWEVAVSVYDDTYQDGRPGQQPVILSAGKQLGFAMAYCDNDRSPERENFMGSVAVPGEDKNRGWIDASIFGTLVLRE